MYKLYLGNKNYSSWSLRGWLAMKLSGAPFTEVMVALSGEGEPNPGNRVVLADGARAVPARRRDRRLGFARDRRIPRRAASGHVAGGSGGAGMGALGMRRDALGLFGTAQRDDDVHPRARRRAAVVDRAAARHRARHRDLERRARSLRTGRSRISAARFRSPTRSTRRSRFASARTASRPGARRAPTCRRCSRIRSCASGRTRRSPETAIIDADEPRIIYRDKLAAKGAAPA